MQMPDAHCWARCITSLRQVSLHWQDAPHAAASQILRMTQWLMLRPPKRRMSRMHVLQLKYMRIMQGGWHIRLWFTTPQSEKQGFDGVGWQGWREHVSGDAKEWEPCYELSNANLKGKLILSLTSFLCFSGIPNRKLEGMGKFCLSHLQSGQY